MDKLPRNQKEYYHNKIREFEKRTGTSMNVNGVSKFYDYKIDDAFYNTDRKSTRLNSSHT